MQSKQQYKRLCCSYAHTNRSFGYYAIRNASPLMCMRHIGCGFSDTREKRSYGTNPTAHEGCMDAIARLNEALRMHQRSLSETTTDDQLIANKYELGSRPA